MEEEKYLKKQRVYKAIMLVILTAFLTFIFTTIYITNKYNSGNGSQTISSLFGGSSNNDKLTKSLKEIKSILKKYYLNDMGSIVKPKYILIVNKDGTFKYEEDTELIIGLYRYIGVVSTSQYFL